jgi:hypothetical protein
MEIFCPGHKVNTVNLNIGNPSDRYQHLHVDDFRSYWFGTKASQWMRLGLGAKMNQDDIRNNQHLALRDLALSFIWLAFAIAEPFLNTEESIYGPDRLHGDIIVTIDGFERIVLVRSWAELHPEQLQSTANSPDHGS